MDDEHWKFEERTFIPHIVVKKKNEIEGIKEFDVGSRCRSIDLKQKSTTYVKFPLKTFKKALLLNWLNFFL